MDFKRKKEKEKKIAAERVKVLFEQAKSAQLQKFRDRYAEIALRISRKIKISLPSEFKRRICRNCGAFLTAGANSSVRTRNGKLVTKCLSCGGIMRFPMIREQKARRKASK